MNRFIAATMAALESYMLAELVWFIVHDGDERLYEIVVEKLPKFWDALMYRAQIFDTVRTIRRLPEL